MRVLTAVILLLGLATGPARAQYVVQSHDSTYLTVNPYLGAPVGPYDARVSPYSPQGAANSYTTGGGRLYAPDGTYLGKVNANQYDPESISNPNGRYGSAYSPTSVNNPNGRYGSRYSAQSSTNPYTRTPPRIVYPTAPAYRLPALELEPSPSLEELPLAGDEPSE